MSKSLKESFKRFYELYTSNLSLNEIERLIKRDAQGVYDFYLNDVDKPDQDQKPVPRTLTFIGNLFMAFLHKLTPARRVVYSTLLVFFLFGLINTNWFWTTLAFILLNILLAFELADKLTAKDDLEVAREIQMGLMPKEAPENEYYEISCFSEAANLVGGDYYDFIHPENMDGVTFIIIGDVSGKGMGAALYMVQVQAILHNLARQYKNPKDILMALNRDLRNVLRTGSFFTISLASFNSHNKLKLCRAGHMPLLLFNQRTKTCQEIIPKGIGIGLPDNGKFDQLLEEIEVTSESGDVFFFYTDGVIETMNSVKVEFGEERLKNIIMKNATEPASAIKNAALLALAQFRGSTAPHDDITIIVMKTL